MSLLEYTVVGYNPGQYLLIKSVDLETFLKELSLSDVKCLVLDWDLEATSFVLPIHRLWEVCPFNIIETQEVRDIITQELGAFLAKKSKKEIMEKLKLALENLIQ